MEHATPPVTTRQISVSEASRELGVSAETVRRWIKSGRLQADRAIRPQGAVWLVTLPVTSPRGVAPATDHTTPQQPLDVASDTESASHTAHATPDVALQPSPAPTVASADVAHLTAAIRQQSESVARLIVELAEARVISDMRAAQLVTQAETIGRLTTERDAERAMHASAEAKPAAILGAQTAPPPVEPAVPLWRRWWLAALALAALLLSGVALVWPR